MSPVDFYQWFLQSVSAAGVLGIAIVCYAFAIRLAGHPERIWGTETACLWWAKGLHRAAIGVMAFTTMVWELFRAGLFWENSIRANAWDVAGLFMLNALLWAVYSLASFRGESAISHGQEESHPGASVGPIAGDRDNPDSPEFIPTLWGSFTLADDKDIDRGHAG